MVLEVDVAIVGGGLAGAALARQLRREVPNADIALFERDVERSFKVGESTVEIASNYLVRKLALSKYLYDEQLPKNGLRFFFDTPERDAPIERMSEIGTDGLPYHPSFQLDRGALERALLEMNAADGIRVHLGTRVRAIRPGTGGAPHELDVEDGDKSTTVRARWLVDASGRARLLQKTLGTPRLDVGHPISAAWGRFVDVTDMDTLDLPEWRARARHTARYLSTNHFCYPGYWIWFIPLAGDVVSLGWVGEKKQFKDAWRKPEGFLAFLREHGAPRSLLERARCLDMLSYGQLAYGTEWFFRPEDRLALVGEAAAFSDPFYSPGSDFIAIENDFVTDMVRRDLGGAPATEVNDLGRRYDAFVHFRFDATILLYRDLYSLLGSRELLQLKWDFDIAGYYNAWVQSYMRDQHLDPAWLDDQLSQKRYVLGAMQRFSELFQKIERAMWAAGTYHRGNLDTFVNALGRCDFVHDIGTPRTRKEVLRTTGRIFNDADRQAQALLGDPSALQHPDRPLFEFLIEPPPGTGDNPPAEAS